MIQIANTLRQRRNIDVVLGVTVLVEAAKGAFPRLQPVSFSDHQAVVLVLGYVIIPILLPKLDDPQLRMAAAISVNVPYRFERAGVLAARGHVVGWAGNVC